VHERVRGEAEDEGAHGDADATDERRVQASLGPALGDVGEVEPLAVLVGDDANEAAKELGDVDEAGLARAEAVDLGEDVRDRDEEEVCAGGASSAMTTTTNREGE